VDLFETAFEDTLPKWDGNIAAFPGLDALLTENLNLKGFSKFMDSTIPTPYTPEDIDEDLELELDLDLEEE